MRAVLVCLTALLSLGAPATLRAQAPAPAAAESAPASVPANTAAKQQPAPAGISAAEISAIGALLVLGIGAVYFTVLFVQQVRSGHRVGIESHWGGLGGGLGGWRISSALCFLIGSLVFAASFSALAIRFLDRDAPPKPVAVSAAAVDAQ